MRTPTFVFEWKNFERAAPSQGDDSGVLARIAESRHRQGLNMSEVPGRPSVA